MAYTYIEESEAYSLYDDMLDEIYPDQVGNILASRILKELDPIAYSCGFDDWLDSCELTIDESEAEQEGV
jgi:hypothetical protein